MQAVRHSARGGVVSIEMPAPDDCWLELELHHSTRLEVYGWRDSGEVHRLTLAVDVCTQDAKIDLSGLGLVRYYGQEPDLETGNRFLIDIVTIDGGDSFEVICHVQYDIEEHDP